MKKLLLLFAIFGIMYSALAQDIIIGSDEFYQLYSWDADTTFSDWEDPPNYYYFDIDQDGENDIQFMIYYYYNSNREKYIKTISTLNNFQIIGNTNHQYIINSYPDYLKTELSEQSLAVPFFQGDTIFEDAIFLQGNFQLSRYDFSIMEPPTFPYYYVDIFHTNPVYIVLKKNAGIDEYIYIMQVNLTSNLFQGIKVRNIYTNDIIFSGNTTLINEGYLVCPNPSNHYISIPKEATYIDIFSCEGNHVLSQEIKNDHTIDIASFAPGIYILKMNIENNIVTSKLIKY